MENSENIQTDSVDLKATTALTPPVSEFIPRFGFNTATQGGVGKSIVASTNIDILTHFGVDGAFYDADYNDGTTPTSLIFGKEVEGYRLMEPDEMSPLPESRKFVESLDSGKSIIFHDIGAGPQLMQILGNLIGEGEDGLEDLFEFIHMKGYRPTLHHIITEDQQTTDAMLKWLLLLERLGLTGDVDHVAYLNKGKTKWIEKIEAWMNPGSELRGRFEDLLSAGQAATVEVPIMKPAAVEFWKKGMRPSNPDEYASELGSVGYASAQAYFRNAVNEFYKAREFNGMDLIPPELLKSHLKIRR